MAITALFALTARAAIATVTTRTTVLARLAGRAGVFQLGAGFLVDQAHRQGDLAAQKGLVGHPPFEV